MTAEDLFSALQAYQQQAYRAFSLFEKRFGPLHELRKGLTPIPKNGLLDEGRVAYCRHGVGCKFSWGEESVDFDFTFTMSGRLGFTLGWIHGYILTHRDQHPSLVGLGEAPLQALLDELVASGRVHVESIDLPRFGMMLYFVP